MPKIMVNACKGEARTRGVRVTLVQVSILDGIWAMGCNGNDVNHECPGDIEAGDTWSDLGACTAEAFAHIAKHEARS